MAWSTNVEYLDTLVKEYLTMRGFLNTVKAMDLDLKQDKDKGFRVDRIMHHIISLIQAYDIDGLKKYWEYLSAKFATVCYASDDTILRKMEIGLYRFYIVHTIQNSKPKEVTTFFQKMTQHLQQYMEWKEWFALPFLVNPESNPAFAIYFSKQWIDTFLVSMHNFVAAMFARRLPPPQLVRAYIDDGIRIQELEKEILKLKKELSVNTLNKNETIEDSNPNYVKAIGTPGALTPQTKTADELPKKKSPFSFVTRTKPMQKSESQQNIVEKPSKSTGTKKPSSSKPFGDFEAQRRELLASSKKINVSNKSLKSNSSGSPQQSPRQSSRTSNSSLLGLSNNSPVQASSTKLNNSFENKPEKITEGFIISEGLNSCQNKIENVEGASINVNDVLQSYEFVTNLHKQQLENSKEDVSSDSIISKSDYVSNNYVEKPFIILSKDTFLEHHSSIVQCRFDTCGTTVASIDSQGVVKAWQYEPNLKTLATVMFRKPILCIQWCIKPNYLLLLGTSSGTIRFFNTSTNTTHEDVQVHEKYSWVSLIATHPNGSSFVASCVKPQSEDMPRTSSMGILQVWDIKSNQIKLNRSLNNEKLPHEVTCMEYNHNGNLLLTGDVCGNIVMFDMKSYEPIHTWQASVGSIYGLEFSIDENKLISLDLHQVHLSPVIYSLPSDMECEYPNIPKGRIMAFDPDGKYLVVCCGKEGIIFKVNEDKKSLIKAFVLPSHKSQVISIDWTSSNSCVHCLTGSIDGRVQVTTLLSE